MNKYETNFTGYLPLKYYVDNECLESPIYLINVEKVSLINNNTKRILKMNVKENGYGFVTLHKKTVSYHRLIWEHCNGLIPQGLEIDHIDENKLNNHISNLQLLTHQQNVLKATKNRDYSFSKFNHYNRHVVKVIDLETNQVEICQSLSGASLFCGVNVGIVKMCCDGTNRCKSGISKKNNHKYKFEYTDEKPTIINKRFGRLYTAAESENLKRKDYNLINKMQKIINEFESDKLMDQIKATDNEFDKITKDFREEL